jgi:hypothetical protein
VRPITIRGHHADKAIAVRGFPVGAGPDLRVVISESRLEVDSDADELNAPVKDRRMDITTGIPRMILTVRM